MTGRRRRALARLAPVLFAIAIGCRTSPPTENDAQGRHPPLTFAEVPVRTLQADPTAHAGDVFLERFLFFRVWWSPDRAEPHQLTTELPTHFEARIVAAPLYVARVEFPASEDARYGAMRDGTELCLRVRFLHLHPASGSPVFALEGSSDRCSPVGPPTK